MTHDVLTSTVMQCLSNIESVAVDMRLAIKACGGVVPAIQMGCGKKFSHNLTDLRTNFRVIERMFKGAF